MRTKGTAAGLAALLAAGPALASPELLAPAMKFGARNCGFCHATETGGKRPSREARDAGPF